MRPARNLVRSGNTTFNGAVQLAGDTTFSGGSVAFNNALNSHTTGFYNATILGPSVVFGGGVGQGRALQSLLTTGNAIANGRITTLGNQTFGGTLTIQGAPTRSTLARLCGAGRYDPGDRHAD